MYGGRGHGIFSSSSPRPSTSFCGRGRGCNPPSPRGMNWDKCALCQIDIDEKLITPKMETYDTVGDNLQQFALLGHNPTATPLSSLNDGSNFTSTLKGNSAKWHKSCYSKTNKTHLERMHKKAAVSSEDLIYTRSAYSATTRSKEICLFCENSATKRYPLRLVATTNISSRINSCAETLMDTLMLAKLSDGDLVAQDARYHIECLSAYYRKADCKLSETNTADISSSVLKATALAELVSYIEQSKADNNITIFKLADLIKLYQQRLMALFSDSNVPDETLIHCTRVKERLLDAMPNLIAEKRGKEIFLMLKEDLAETMFRAYQEQEDIEALQLLNAAKIVRKYILQSNYQFNGTFTKSAERDSVPPKLFQLVEFILHGGNIKTKTSDDYGVKEKMVLSMSQLLIYNSTENSKAQVRYRHETAKETPLPIYLSIYTHNKTRSKELVETLHNHGLGISYQRMMDISIGLGKHTINTYSREGVVFPMNAKLNIPTAGTIDNLDTNYTSTLAQDSFHGTAICLLQFPSEDNPGDTRPDGEREPIQRTGRCVKSLIDSYAVVPAASLSNKDPIVPPTLDRVMPGNTNLSFAKRTAQEWLDHVQALVESDSICKDTNLSWAAYHAAKSIPELVQSTINLMPLFYEPSHTTAMMLHGMRVVKKAIEYLNPGQIPYITGDQPLYALMKQIQWQHSAELGESRYVVMMGALHIEMTIFKLLGRWVEGSGWATAITESGVTTAGRANHAEKCGDLAQTKYFHQVTAAALSVCRNQAYSDYLKEGALNFDDWCRKMRSTEPQFNYWSETLQLELDAFLFVQSIRNADFLLYREAISNIIPMFFVMDNIHYARWTVVHLRDMMQLEFSHPQLYEEFLKGHFTVSQSGRTASNIAMDHAHEQENKNIKGEGGAIGLFQDESALRKFCIVGPEFVRLCKEFDDQYLLKRDTKHHEQTFPFQSQFHKDVKNLVNQLVDMGNPFSEDSGCLFALDTKVVMDQTSIDSIVKARKLGNEQANEFIDTRITSILTGNQPLTNTLKRNKLKLFGVNQRKGQGNEVSALQNLKADNKLFSDMYISTQHRECDLAEFFRHENSIYPPAISSNGTMRKGIKSELIGCLTNSIIINNEIPEVDTKIFDGPAIVQMLQPKGCRTFTDYADRVFLPYLRQQAETCSRIDLVFDVYKEDSLKEQTRMNRGTGIRRRITGETPIPTNWQGLLRVDDNKTELYAFLADKVVAIKGDKQIFCTKLDRVVSSHELYNSQDISPCTHEEADTRMILHANHSSKQGMKRVLIRTVDTDVIVLAIAFYDKLKLHSLFVSFGTGKHFRNIPVHELAQTLGPIKSLALPMFHALTGCDTTSSFSGKGKKTAWSVWKSTPELDKLFVKLFNAPNTLSASSIEAIERFVIRMYQKGSELSSCDDARRDLFTGGRSVENIPPTTDALILHIRRSMLQAGHIWSQCLVACPIYPNPEAWGWMRTVDDKLQPQWTNLPQASKACRALLRCTCKVRCSGKCQCSTAKLKCTELCNCKATCTNCT